VRQHLELVGLRDGCTKPENHSECYSFH
jgi:hypothetical protein